MMEKLNDLIVKLEHADKRYSRIAKRFQYIYLVLGLLYLVPMICDLSYKNPWTDFAGSLCCLIGMMIAAVLFSNYYKEYKSVDYGQPTLEMLKQAVRRWTPFYGKRWLLFFALLFIYAGMSLRRGNVDGFIETSYIFLVSLVLGACIGLAIWWVRNKPIRDEAKRMIREMEGQD